MKRPFRPSPKSVNSVSRRGRLFRLATSPVSPEAKAQPISPDPSDDQGSVRHRVPDLLAEIHRLGGVVECGGTPCVGDADGWKQQVAAAAGRPIEVVIDPRLGFIAVEFDYSTASAYRTIDFPRTWTARFSPAGYREIIFLRRPIPPIPDGRVELAHGVFLIGDGERVPLPAADTSGWFWLPYRGPSFTQLATLPWPAWREWRSNTPVEDPQRDLSFDELFRPRSTGGPGAR